MRDEQFDALWGEPAARSTARFSVSQVDGLCEPARRYLRHAVSPGASIATAVRLRMHGEIKQKSSWHSFEADQVIRSGRGFVWRARTKMKGFAVTGSDRWVDGVGAMRWKLLGLIPVVTATGADISRAALGRVQVELVWLPTSLLAPDVRWASTDTSHVGVDLNFADAPGHLDLSVGADGRLRTASISRWGNPEWSKKNHTAFRTHPFGAIVSAEKTFEGITIPTEMRVGWYFGTERFETEGEFFRVTVDNAEFR